MVFSAFFCISGSIDFNFTRKDYMQDLCWVAGMIDRGAFLKLPAADGARLGLE
jgi:hypothetical protein